MDACRGVCELLLGCVLCTACDARTAPNVPVEPPGSSMDDASASFGPDANVTQDGHAPVPEDASGAENEPNDPRNDASIGQAEPDAGPLAPFEGEGQPWTEPAPRATCGPGDQADPSISGLSADVRCNLEIVGQVSAPHFASVAWYDDCIYVNGTDSTTVIQVAPDGTPSVTVTLTTLGFRNNWESMKVSPQSKLLVGYEANGSTLTVYDVGQDCANPELQSSTSLSGFLGGTLGHAGNFSPDGTIYYASSMYTSEVLAVDLTNPKRPSVITSTFERGAHDLYVAKGGTRGYFAMPDLSAGQSIGSFAVMDLSEVQARAANATGRLITEVSWQDGAVSQYPMLITYRSKDYLMITDELGLGTCDDPKRPQWGYARIFDMSDEQNPTPVSLIKTEAQDPKNCQIATTAPGAEDILGFGFGTHYCNVDRLDDPRLLSCANWEAGVRVYDIRNPWRPKEVAYFDTASGGVPGLSRIHTERRELWVATAPDTFYVLKFRPGSTLDAVVSN